MPDILEQIGVKLPPPPTAGLDTSTQPPDTGMTEIPGATPKEASPVVEASSPMSMSALKDITDTLLAGCVLVIEQAITQYGVTTEEGKHLLKAIDHLMAVVPESKIKEAATQITSVMQPSKGASVPPPTGGVPPAGGGLPPAGGMTLPI